MLSLPIYLIMQFENGNIVWDKNWDLIFPVEQLHSGKLVQ